MYTYEQVLSASTEYFNGDELAAKVYSDKYSLQDNDGNYFELTPKDMHHRLAKEFARIEKKKFANPLSEEEIFNLFDRFKYIIPQGSPMFGVGNDYQIVSLSNCYLLESPIDNYSSILDTDKQLVNISKRRGGVGIDLDNLRPKGTITRNAAKTSTGIISWMERYSNSIREVGQNARRGALLLSISVHHPDILDFCTVKNDDTKITGANISVKLTKEFLDAVKDDAEYELRWPITGTPKISKMISAKKVWNTIVHSAWLRAEPGLLMWDNVTKNTPADYYEEYKSIGTNPCSEINLSQLDSCRLLCLNLYSYVKNPFTPSAKFDYELFYKHAQIAQRLMDDLVDLEAEKIHKIIKKIDSDPEPENVKKSEKDMWLKILRFNNEGRRTGTGITALGDTLAALNIKYGSNKSINTTEKIYQTLKFGCLRSSIDMSKELGSFKCYDKNKEKKCNFIQKIKDEEVALDSTDTVKGNDLISDMEKYGRRNICLTTTAPTGTVSILTQTSSGIEPVFMLSYTRRKKINHGDKNTKVDFVDRNGDKWQEFTVYHPKVKEWMQITGNTDIKESPWYGACAEEIDWINRVKLQAAAQNHVCHSISSTINLPENITEDEVGKIYETAFNNGIKGITVYRNNCRSGVLVSNKPAVNNSYIKRPKEVECDIHHLSVKGKPYVVFVGKINGVPYEVFAGKNGVMDPSINKGLIVKVKASFYKAVLPDGLEISPLTNICSEEEEILSRMTSMSLRHNVDTKYIVEQLSKVHGEMNSFAKCLARTLKKYIKDGTETKENCPECATKLVYSSGCSQCPNCGYSKCQ